MRAVSAFPAVVAALALSGLAGGCGGDADDDAGADASFLTVEQTFVGDSLYVEGARSFVRVATADGDEVAERTLPDARPALVVVRLEPGDYLLSSWQRPCSGNCDELDPPTDECESSFTLEAGDRTRASIRVSPGSGCEIDFE